VERSYKWREVTSGEKLQVERSYKFRSFGMKWNPRKRIYVE
jgi:hypothetical protein